MEFKKLYSIDSRKDGFVSILFVDEEGRHFHSALVSKLLSDDAVEKIKDIIAEDVNR
jgi:hypothetical protein